MALSERDYKSMAVVSSADAVEDACQRLLAEVTVAGFGEEDVFAIHLALGEAMMNAARHGNNMDPQKNLAIEYSITLEKFDISITDEGTGFEPDMLPDPRSDENLYKYGGRGVLLMRAYMDVVEFNAGGNRVHMVKYR